MISNRTFAITAFLGSCLLLILTVSASKQVRDWRLNQREHEYPEPIGSLLEDPEIGAAVEFPVVDIFGRPTRTPRSDSATLLVMSGGCSSCSAIAFDPNSGGTSRFSVVVVVYQAQERQIREFFLGKKIGPNLRVLADPSGAMHLRLNAFLTPRYYSITNGTINAIQRRPDKQSHRA